MGYRVPRRVLITGDMPDPDLLIVQAQPAVEELAGRLNDHNFEAGSILGARRKDAAFFDFHYAATDADTGINTNANDIPDNTDPDAWRLPDSGEWAVVGDMEVDFTCGEDVVWALGWCQYGLAPTGAVVTFDLGTVSQLKARVQVALRVNGALLSDTITGVETAEASPRPVYPLDPIDVATPANSVSIDTLRLRGTSSLCWPVRAVRVQGVVPVPQGECVVELVARRVPPDDDGPTTGEIEPVYLYSRKLLAVQMKRTEPGVTIPASSVAVVYPEAGDDLDETRLTDNILTPLQDTINDLQEGAILQHGLRRDHLPGGEGGVQDAEQTAITDGNTTARTYPGYGSDGTVGAGNWAEVQDSGGTPLRVTGPWDYSADPAFVLILANVAHRKAEDTGIPPAAEQYAVYAIGGQDNAGTNFHDAGAEAFVNNPSVLPSAWGTALFDCDTDVPLLLWYDYRSAPPANPVSFYRVLASFCGSAGAPTVEWQAGSLQVLHFTK